MSKWIEASEKDKNKFSENGYALTYGELTLEGLKEIMKKVGDQNNKVFVDLGSGDGNVVINVAKNFKGIFKAIGIELCETRYNTAIKKLKDETNNIQKKIHFSYNDILDDGFDYSDFDIMYISNLCFSDDINKKLTAKIKKECNPNTHIFCSKPLFDITHESIFQVKQTWTNKSNIHHYKIK